MAHERPTLPQPPRGPTPIAVAVVCHRKKYLIGRRPEGVPLAGFWEFPGGKVRPGETAVAAAVRECREETGLDVVVVEAYPDVVQQYDHDRVRITFFACLLAGAAADGPAPEVVGYIWVTAAEMRHYEFPPANAGLPALLSGSAENKNHGRDGA